MDRACFRNHHALGNWLADHSKSSSKLKLYDLISMFAGVQQDQYENLAESVACCITGYHPTSKLSCGSRSLVRAHMFSGSISFARGLMTSI